MRPTTVLFPLPDSPTKAAVFPAGITRLKLVKTFTEGLSEKCELVCRVRGVVRVFDEVRVRGRNKSVNWFTPGRVDKGHLFELNLPLELIRTHTPEVNRDKD